VRAAELGAAGRRVYCTEAAGSRRQVLLVSLAAFGNLKAEPRVERLGAPAYLGLAALVRTPDAMAGVQLARGSSVAAHLAPQGPQAVWCAGELSVVAVLHVVRNGRLLVADEAGAVREVDECADDWACRWTVARGGWGGVACVSRARLETQTGGRVAYALPAAPALGAVQPAHEVSGTFGTRWRSGATGGCNEPFSQGATLCVPGDSTCRVCDAWEGFAAPFSCVDVAAHGWCSAHPTAVGGVCALSCGLHYGEVDSAPAGARFYVEALSRVLRGRGAVYKSDSIFAKTPPQVAMYVPDADGGGNPRVAVMADLSAALKSGRWNPGGVTQDPSVSTENATVEAWPERDRKYFWQVLEAMSSARLSSADPALGACVHFDVERTIGADRWVGFNLVVTARDEPTSWRDGESADDLSTCERACVKTGQSRRNLSYFGVLGMCADMTKAEWERVAASLPKQPTREANAAQQLDEELKLNIARAFSEGMFTALPRLKPGQRRRLVALLTRDYGALSWAEVALMFNLTVAELGVLQRAVAPAGSARASQRNEWRSLTPRRRLALVREWNARARIAFCTPTAASLLEKKPHAKLGCAGDRTVLMPRATDNDGFRPFYTLWPTDRLTGVGANTRDGNPRSCHRCRGEVKAPVPLHPQTKCGDTPESLAEKAKGVLYEEDGTTYLLKGQAVSQRYTERRACEYSRFGPWEHTDYSLSREYGRVLFNDCVASVDLPPGFACYVTPHLHSYHMSERSCMSGMRHLFGPPVGEGAQKLQCRVDFWMPERETFDVKAATPRGYVLINDDLARRWTVRSGDVLYAKEVTDNGDSAFERFPAVVNCLAVWNYYAEPGMWLQRAHSEPNAGDSTAEFEAVAGETNNVRRTSDDIAAFIEYHNGPKVNVRTVLRTQDADGILKRAKEAKVL
jgi:hypothetical protein